MRRLTAPDFTFFDTVTISVSGIASAVLRDKYGAQLPKTTAETIENEFVSLASAGTLHLLARTPSNSLDIPILGSLTKTEFIKLYTQYFSAKGKPGRKFYDLLKLTSDGKCPLCGGIGHVRTLDHYVPKANFPLYSVMPGNLVPCCRDCNSEKLDSFPTTAGAQTLHPYFDNDKFFSERWLDARVLPVSPPVIEYFVSPPLSWSAAEVDRVSSHFASYDLARRFSVEAGADLTESIFMRRGVLSILSPQQFSEYLLEKGSNLSLPINNWRRIMFNCLARDNWFCSHSH